MRPGDVADAHMRAWLRSPLSGCKFAPRIASKAARLISTTVDGLSEDLPAVMNALLDGAAAKSMAALFTFPGLRTSNEVVELVALLQSDDRWQVRDVPWREATREAVIVGVNWRTPVGKLSRVMGFAPLGTMPVTRRAPFVGIALWPGDRENQCWKDAPPSKFVSFADMPPGCEQDEHDALWSKSAAWTKDLLARPPEGAARPTATFCLDVAARSRLFPST